MLNIILAVALLLSGPIVVSARADAQPGDTFSITLTYFDAQPAFVLPLDPRLEYIEGDATQAGAELVFPPTIGPRTLYATFRARAAGDIRFPGGQVVRITGMGKLYLPVLRH